jgi:hypothetical protein
MTSFKWFLLSFLGCGIAFWIPDLIVAAFDRASQGGVVTVASPITLMIAYLLLRHLRKNEGPGPSTAIFAICGMWILALSFVLLAQKIRSEKGLGGFNSGDWGYLLLSSFMPTRIFMFVGFEGSIFALLLGTVAMIICHFKFESARWIIPPSLRAALRHWKQ